MIDYEILLLLDPELPADRQTEIVERVRELVERGGGTWLTHEPWGRRKLAYEIDGKLDGAYHLVNFDATPAASPRATFHSYPLDCRSLRSRGFVMNPVSTRTTGTFAQLKPVRSERATRPRLRAFVTATTRRSTSFEARMLGR